MNEIEIKKYELPALEIKDYENLKKMAEDDTEKYKNYIVTEETLDDDAKKRAELRKTAKKINDKRLEIEREVSAPIKKFKEDCDYLKKLYENSADLIDTQIKIFENKKKEEKKEMCKEIYEKEIDEFKDNISFDQLFNEKWLNKTTKSKEIESEIKAVVENARQSVETIKSLNSEFELELLNTYFETLDVSKAIMKDNALKEQAEKMKEVMDKQKQMREQKVEKMLTEEVKEEEIDPIKTYLLEITGPLSKQKKLREFLELNNMKFKKVDRDGSI